MAGTFVAIPAAADTDGRIRVELAAGTGPAVTGWGFDIKQAGKAWALANDRNLANRIFRSDGDGLGMSVLRIPVWAMSDVHPRAGTVNGDVADKSYRTIVTAVANAEAADEARDVQVFASLKLHPSGGMEFADWTKPPNDGDDGVNPERYAELLLDYLTWMIDHGVQVDVLGVDNESAFNEGQITPSKHAAIVRQLRGKIAAHNEVTADPAKKIRVPLFVAPESFRPQGWFLDQLTENRGWDTVDIVGVHYYNTSNEEPDYLASFGRFAGKARERWKPLWDSEFHWDRHPDDELTSDYTPRERYRDSVSGMVGAAYHFDQGFTGMTWWNLATDGSYLAQVQAALVRSTARAMPYARVDDRDGPAATSGTLTTRALRQGNDVVVWIVNDTAREDRSMWIWLAGGLKVSRPQFECWQYRDEQLRPTQGTGSVVSTDAVAVQVPPYSIQVVRIPHVL